MSDLKDIITELLEVFTVLNVQVCIQLALTDQFWRHLYGVGGLFYIILLIQVSVASQYLKVSGFDGTIFYLLSWDLNFGWRITLGPHYFILLDPHRLKVLLIFFDKELFFFPQVWVARLLLN